MRKVEQAVYKREAVAAKARLAKEGAGRRQGGEGEASRRGRAAEDTVSSAARGRAAHKDATTKQGLKQACVELKRESRRSRLRFRDERVGGFGQVKVADEEAAAAATPSPRYARARMICATRRWGGTRA